MVIEKVLEKGSIEKILYEFKDSFFNPMKEEDISRYAEKWCEYAEVYIGKEGKITAGLLVFYINHREMAYLTSIVVKKECQRKGYGERLLKYFIETSRLCGFEKMRLEVNRENQKAIKLYEKYGFQIEENTETAKNEITTYMEKII